MAWNEPGKDKKTDEVKKDPWTAREKSAGPPDLEEMLKKLRKKLLNAFGGKVKPSIGATADSPLKFNFTTVGGFVLIVLLIWALSGIYIVHPAFEAVVLRFGKYVSTEGPGPHWIPRFISSKYVVNVRNTNTLDYNVEVLTRDTNIINLQLVVQYRVDNPRDYLFNITDASNSLEQATAAAVRHVVGQIPLSYVLPIAKVEDKDDANLTQQDKSNQDDDDQSLADENSVPSPLTKALQQAQQNDNESKARDLIRDEIAKRLTETVAIYNAGVEISDVTLQHIKPPQGRVSEAYDDANRSREDEKRVINQAKSYSADIRPKALGLSARITQIANADQQKIILGAEGDVAAYSALLPEYKKAPAVTRERLYIDTIQSVLTNSSKILVDTQSGNMMYLPLDKLLNQAVNATETSKTNSSVLNNNLANATVKTDQQQLSSADASRKVMRNMAREKRT